MAFHQQRLPQGLTILAETDAQAHTAAVGFLVRTGARDEPAHWMGVSHFLEHMVFKGSATRRGDEINQRFDDLGANYNAFTGHESTVYYAQVLPEYLAAAVDLIGDMLAPALREEDLALEKQVILEEIGMYDDQPAWRLQDTLLENHYRGHPLAHRVLGTQATVSALNAATLRRYYEQRYHPGQIIVVAAGQVDFTALVAAVAATPLAKVSKTPCPSGPDQRIPPTAQSSSQTTLTDAKLTRHYLALAWPAPAAQSDQRYAAKVFADMLGDGDGSRLHWALVDPGVADEATVSVEPQDGTGVMIGFAACPPQDAARVEQTYLETVQQLVRDIRHGGPTIAAELERAKNKIATNVTLAGEQPMGRLSSLGGSWLYLGRYLTLEEELRRLLALTPADLAALVEAFPLAEPTIARLGPSTSGGSGVK